ncbi:hypothetical protein [Cycloclasticus pugetii]|uniref:hypothetical protein n=1 Tax=Cycloclasticus pugetii TaxID=34068 RepID=UPI003A946A8F
MKPLSFLLVIILTGCAHNPVSLSQDVTLVPWHSTEAIGSVRFPADSDSGDVEFCVAKNVVNSSVTFSDSANSFFGAFTGNYYQTTDSETSGGGSVIQHASEKGVIAVGVTSYEVSSLIKRFVRFKLTAKPRQYEFENIEQVQANSGAAPNTGFQPVGAFTGANPDLALEALEKIVADIDRCRES